MSETGRKPSYQQVLSRKIAEIDRTIPNYNDAHRHTVIVIGLVLGACMLLRTKSESLFLALAWKTNSSLTPLLKLLPADRNGPLSGASARTTTDCSYRLAAVNKVEEDDRQVLERTSAGRL